MPQSDKRPLPKHFGGVGPSPQMIPEFQEVLPGQLSPGADDSTTFHETPQHLDLSLTSSPLSEHLHAHSSTACHFPFEHEQQGHRSAALEDPLSRSPHARAWNVSFPAEDSACDLRHSLVICFPATKARDTSSFPWQQSCGLVERDPRDTPWLNHPGRPRQGRTQLLHSCSLLAGQGLAPCHLLLVLLGCGMKDWEPAVAECTVFIQRMGWVGRPAGVGRCGAGV